MRFRICLLAARLSLASRALRALAAATLLAIAAAALRASKRVGYPAPSGDGGHQSEIDTLKSAITPPQPTTVVELLHMAKGWHTQHFVLRVPGALIEITQVNETLEKAAFAAGSEGHVTPRFTPPYFSQSHRIPSDKTA